ncbi:RUN domain-containing protein 1-like [Babylonia areolata]|uniref:RUN domain-containing protein 1-like n=1 Tax=Babylonia areolata TaxID=304850 RepID=UPI003FCFE36B
MEEDITTTTTTTSMPQTSLHDVNFNETPPCFSIYLSRRLKERDSTHLDFDYEYNSSDEEDGDWPTERWAPLGAAYSPTSTPAEPSDVSGASDRLLRLEEEQEQLNSSLLALTSHFAQVQFRLKQIVSAEPSDREGLLKELEDFAFKGIPDVRGCHVQDAQLLEEMSTKEHEKRMTVQREKQQELITQLKSQLEDLETFAYESGHAEELPTSRVLEKQKVLLEEVRSRLHIDLHNFDTLSTEELKDIVNNAITSIVNPAKVKEKLIDQLKTQVVDLERFIQFLQGETDSPGPYGEQSCTCPVHSHSKVAPNDTGGIGCCSSTKKSDGGKGKGEKPGEKRKGMETTAGEIWRKALAVLQIYVFSQLGCGGQDVNKNMLKKTSKGNHWGEVRERLDEAVTRTVDLAQQQQQRDRQWVKDSCTEGELINSDADELVMLSSPAVTMCVRKELAIAIRDLMQHGLVEVGRGSGLERIGCFSSRSADVSQRMHAWDLLARFYDMKHGREYNESPARKLSQSFHLDMVGGKPITAKQTLLGAIDTVLNSHARFHCGKDSYFKAFVCLALNEQKLVTWLRLLFRTQTLIDKHYLDWSYAAHTGFEDALQSLSRLGEIDFHLPVDLSVRSFNNIRDAF